MKEENVSLKKYNTYGIGGIAKYLYHPKNNLELETILSELKKDNISYYILGNGSNIILPDEDYDGAIIKLDLMQNIDIKDDIFEVSAGVLLSKFINKMLSHGFTNYAPLMGIPGTIGGAIVGNVGSFGNEIFSDLISVTVLSKDGKIKEILKEDINYGYRYTEFKNSNVIILSAKFKGYKGNVDEAKELIKENMQYRKEKQPLEYKNAGSVFKNPEGHKAAELIDSCGLKGFKINDAMVSKKHANFIINLGNATSKDIIDLINIIKEKVYEKYNIMLELEQIIVKW